jgi:hypothetical protein
MNATYTWIGNGGQQMRRCIRCMLIVDERGKPNPMHYSPEWIEHFNASPEEKCTHTKGGIRVDSALDTQQQERRMNAIYVAMRDDGRLIRGCTRCGLRVDEQGKPDPTYYSPKWIKQFNASSEGKCTHTKGGTRVDSALDTPGVWDYHLGCCG